MNKITKFFLLNYKLIIIITSIVIMSYGIYLRLFCENQDWFQKIIVIITSIVILCFIIACITIFVYLFLSFSAFILSNIDDFFDKIDGKLERNKTGLSYNKKQKIYAEFKEELMLKRQKAENKGKEAHQKF